MGVKTVNVWTVEELVALLIEKREAGWIFRGQTNAKYKLIPAVFRKPDNIIKKRWEPEPPLWVDDDETTCPKYPQWADEVLEEKRKAKKRHLYPHPPEHIKKAFCFLMAYQSRLLGFKENKKIEENASPRCPSSGLDEHAFKELFSFYLHQVDMNNKFFDDGTHCIPEIFDILNELSYGDETLPQHYDFPTAALDWSRDPFTACWFALFQPDPKKIGIFFEAKEEPSPYCSIFMLNPVFNSELIKVIDPSPEIKNIRAERQQGVFTYYLKAISFFHQNGRFPTIEDCLIKNSAIEIERVNLSLEEDRALIVKMKNKLQTKGITEEFLFPDPD